MLFQSALPGRAIDARVVSQSDDAAEVEATVDGGATSHFRAVRESGRWRVELPLAQR
jgi:hypothetical protein